MKTFLKVLTVILVLLNATSPAYAIRTLIITSDKTSLFGDENMIVNASPSGFTDGESIYLKGAFYQEGSTNYFGYTKKDDNWIKNGDSTLNQRSIKIGGWDKNIFVKSDFSDSGYKGEGGYKFKIGFYYLTSTGNPSSVNWSNVLDINLNEPDPTPTPTGIPINTPEPTNAPTSEPTIEPTVRTTLTIKPKSITPTLKTKKTTKEILGLSKISTPTGTIKEKTKKTKVLSSKSSNTTAKILVVGGAILIGFCGILALRSYRKNKGYESL